MLKLLIDLGTKNQLQTIIDVANTEKLEAIRCNLRIHR